MKIVTYLLIALLVAAVGAAAFFYLYMFKPIEADYQRMTAGMPELERAKAKVKKYEEKDAKETAWIKPAVDALNSALSDEIKAGQAEVVVAGSRVLVNISEQALFVLNSYTFSNESPKLREKLVSLLKSNEVKGKVILIGNTTQAVQAQGKGRKKTPAKDARTLASDRSAALLKYLEKNGVDQDMLVAVAYSSKQPDSGIKLKDRKTMGLRDLQGFERAASRARQLGCEGASCIHPDQVSVLNRVFLPPRRKSSMPAAPWRRSRKGSKGNGFGEHGREDGRHPRIQSLQTDPPAGRSRCRRGEEKS